MSAHTPGPWVLEIDCEDGGYSHYVRARPGCICLMPGWKIHKEYAAQQIANAHLIAAAPELLEALYMVREAAIDMRGDDFNLTTEQWSKFHAVIAKATGAAS